MLKKITRFCNKRLTTGSTTVYETTSIIQSNTALQNTKPSNLHQS